MRKNRRATEPVSRSSPCPVCGNTGQPAPDLSVAPFSKIMAGVGVALMIWMFAIHANIAWAAGLVIFLAAMLGPIAKIVLAVQADGISFSGERQRD